MRTDRPATTLGKPDRRSPHRFVPQAAAIGEEARFADWYLVAPDKAALSGDIVRLQNDIMQTVRLDAVCIYIGIPFCTTRCSYCSFPARVAKEGEMEAYVAALLSEMQAAARALKSGGLHPVSVYIGGGTPTSLPAHLLAQVLESVAAHFGKAAECTLEAGRPDTLDMEKLSIAKKTGVTRLCINPQTMVDRTLRAIGRRHSAKEFLTAVEKAKNAGFARINMDIIAGLPGESAADFAATLGHIEALKPSAFTCHTLSLKRGSRLKTANHDLCDAQTAARMVDDARRSAQRLGMQPYYLYRQKYMAGNLENVGYAVPGFACLYNIAMMDELLPVMGLGVGAVSKLLKGDLILREANPRDLFVYLERQEHVARSKERLFCVDKGQNAVYNVANGDDEEREAGIGAPGRRGHD